MSLADYHLYDVITYKRASRGDMEVVSAVPASLSYTLGSITSFGKDMYTLPIRLGDHGSQKATKVAPTVLSSRGH